MRRAFDAVFCFLPLVVEARWQARVMNPQYLICGLIAVGILVYLIVALLKPEIFS